MKVEAIIWMLIFLLLPLDRFIAIGPRDYQVWNIWHVFFFVALCFLYYRHWRFHRAKLTGGTTLVLTSLVLLFVYCLGTPTWLSLQAMSALLLIAWSTPLLRHFIGRRRGMVITIFILSLTIHALWALTQFSLQSDLNLTWIGETALTIGHPGIATFTSIGGTKIVRAYGPYPHPNILAGSLVLGLIVLASQVKVQPRKTDFAIFTLRYFLSLSVLLTFSRIGWLAAAIVSLVSYTTKTKGVRVFFVLMTLATLSPLFVGRSLDAHDVAAAERAAGAQYALAILRAIPIWHGVGPGNYEPSLEHYFRSHHTTYEPWQVAPVHSIPLLLAVEWGILPLSVLTLWLFYHYASHFRRTSFYLLPIIPLFCLDHYLLTAPAPLLYLVTVLLLLAD